VRDLETATRKLAIALSEWERAVNEEYRLAKKSLELAGNYFPQRNAQIAIQEELKQIVVAGSFSNVQCGGINAAWSAWRPPQNSRSLTYRPMGGGWNG